MSILEKNQFLMILIKVNKQLTAEKGKNCEIGKNILKKEHYFFFMAYVSSISSIKMH